MPAKYVIHTVGPRYRDGNNGEPEILASCYRESLRIADDHQVASIAFPAVSTGIYGYPVEEAAEVAVKSVVEILPTTDHVRQVRFVLFDNATCSVFVRAAEKLSRLTNSAIFEKGHS
jgi:O-acetyl-ADP-ribose deacetylase